jgi:hypothetical protein
VCVDPIKRIKKLDGIAMLEALRANGWTGPQHQIHDYLGALQNAIMFQSIQCREENPLCMGVQFDIRGAQVLHFSREIFRCSARHFYAAINQDKTGLGILWNSNFRGESLEPAEASGGR